MRPDSSALDTTLAVGGVAVGLVAPAGGAGFATRSTQAIVKARVAVRRSMADDTGVVVGDMLTNAGPRARELASQALMDTIVKHGRRVFQGEDVDTYLDAMIANASSGGGDLLLRSDPRKVEALEEFLHGTQEEIGLFERLSRHELERHVKDFMIRHGRILGIAEEDVTWLRKSREMYE